MNKVRCPHCKGLKYRGQIGGFKMPCAVCLGSGKIDDDPWWIAYYRRVFGDDEEIQIELEL